MTSQCSGGRPKMAYKPRVLLIDDSEMILKCLKLYLSARFEVFTAIDGFVALEEFGD